MHPGSYQWVDAAVQRWGPFGSVAELASFDVNGSPRPCFAGASTYVGVDLRPGPGVDVVADARTWTPDRTFDAVVCCSLFEHLAEWPEVLGHAWSLLEPGGVLIVTTVCDPFPEHSAIDGGPLRPGEHYRGVTEFELVDETDHESWTLLGSSQSPEGDACLTARKVPLTSCETAIRGEE